MNIVKIFCYVFIGIVTFISHVSLAANEGVITHIAFAGENMGSHPNVVQIQVEGGYDFTGCDKINAAIRKNDTHLISAALSAYISKTPIKVWLNSSDKYYPAQDRCVITYVELK